MKGENILMSVGWDVRVLCPHSVATARAAATMDKMSRRGLVE